MRRIMVLGFVGLFSWALLGAQAQDQGDPSQAPPVSDAVVARLSLIRGDVTTQRGDTGEWATGAINTPLVSGDKVAAGAGARAEVQLDYADLLRLGDNAQANLVNLSRNQFQIQLASGLADYVVRKDFQASSEIDTPNISIRPNGPGVLRILVSSDSETEVIVRKGEADISTPQGSTTLRQGQQITVEGTDTPQYKITDAPENDSWDRWNQERDNTVRDAKAYQYTNPYYTGVQDLDGYGYWTDVPGYGQVWVPNHQNSGWSPYSDGSWTWEPYWGWTWVGYEPWGWAPYHYGRWFNYGSRWAWWPGPVTPYYRPVWAPAYVSFFGWGGGGFGVGVGFGFGSIGWLPIGPCDPFRPWWGGRRFSRIGYAQFGNRDFRRGDDRVIAPLARLGAGRVVYSNLDSMRTNARVRAAIIRVPANEFGRGGARARQHVSSTELRRGSMLGGTLPVVPHRQSLTVGRQLSRPAGPRSVATHFFGRATVAPRASFAQEQSRIQGRLGGNVRAGASATRPATPPATPAAGNVRTAQPGMRSFDNSRGPVAGRVTASPGAARALPRNTHIAGPKPAPAQRTGGWQRFGSGNASPRPSNNNPPRTFNNPTPRGGNPRTFSSPAPRATPRPSSPRPSNNGWQRFQPQLQGQTNGASSRGASSRGANGRSFQRGGSSAPYRSQPSYGGGGRPNYGGSQPSYRGGGGSRPPLQVGHPIVEAPRPSYRSSAPSYRGGGGAPRGNPGGGGRVSAPSHGGGGGHVSAPSHGGGGHPAASRGGGRGH